MIRKFNLALAIGVFATCSARAALVDFELAPMGTTYGAPVPHMRGDVRTF